MTSSIRTLLLIALTTGLSHGETRVSGVIDSYVRWSPEESPYIVKDDILVARGARLVITPGTRIVLGQPSVKNREIPQRDQTDSHMVAIKVEGSLTCTGRRNNRISFSPLYRSSAKCSWYGIVYSNAHDELSEVAFTDISGACNGVVAEGCAPLIRNTVLRFNNVAIRCIDKGHARVFNCVLTGNQTCGVKVNGSNPTFYNNIIAFNRNNGLWCDGASVMAFEYNCVYGNPDGNFLDCDPELGVLVRTNANGDSTDTYHNIYKNPVFAGSAADSLAAERDIYSRTDMSRVEDTSLARVLYDSLPDSAAASPPEDSDLPYELSEYSPCIDAGKKGRKFKDRDGTRNDMGIHGGQEFLESR